MDPNSPSLNQTQPRSELTTFESTIGYILAFSYPILALSTGVRSLYQLFLKEGVTYYLPAVLSGVAALCYLTATVGFIVRKRWAWWLSVSVLAFESSMTLIVGVLSFVQPDLIGSTVWRHFGADYGFFPFVQPILGLIWLTRPAIMRAYGVRDA
ncbi:MAG: hypothetical protein J5I90_06040 [Caldilineales bacterium]|nr:hypothetical protein [Caldilineales bacterium]